MIESTRADWNPLKLHVQAQQPAINKTLVSEELRKAIIEDQVILTEGD